MKDHTVLVVEAEPDLRVLLKDCLELWEMRVWVASSCSTALTLLEQLRPDLLLSEIELFGGSGYSLIQQWRAYEAAQGWKPIPAIAVSIFDRCEHWPLAKAAGFQAYIEKPFDLDELQAQIEWALRQCCSGTDPSSPPCIKISTRG